MSSSSRKKWELDRRTFLRGLGLSIGLPFLEAMVPSVARATYNGKPQRLVWIYMPLGSGARDYFESGFYPYPQVLKDAVDPIRADTTTVLNLSVFPGNQWLGGPTGNAHPNCFVPFINGGTHADFGAMRKTFDQYIADVNRGSLGADRQVLSLTPQYWSVGDISDPHANTLSYRGTGQAVTPVRDPREVLNILFSGGTGTQIDERVQDQLKRKRGILHYVMDDIKKVNSVVGRDDKIRLDEYLSGISDIEKRIAAQLGSPTQTGSCQGPAMTDTSTYPARLRFCYDLLLYAFRCDSMRVATLMHGIEGGTGINHRSFIQGMQTGSDWHGLSHWQTPNYQDSSGDINVNYADLSRIIRWHNNEIVQFVQKLKAVSLPTGGTLLDECAVVWGSSMGFSTSHDPRGLCFHIAGTASGALRKGVTVDARGASMANFYVTLMQAFGSSQNQIGSSNGQVSGIRV